jgi:hypothetical protein
VPQPSVQFAATPGAALAGETVRLAASASTIAPTSRIRIVSPLELRS